MERGARRQRKENEQPKEPTEAQSLTAKIDSFLTVANTAKKAAKEYAHSLGIKGKEKKKLVKETSERFTDLYFIRQQGLPEEPFNEKWGDKATIYQELVDLKNPELHEKNVQSEQDAWKLTTAKQTAIVTKASRRLLGLTKEQRQSLFEITGYTEDEGRYVNVKLFKAFLGSMTTGAGLSNFSIVAVTANEAINPSLDYGFITDPKMAIALGISYVAQYSSMGIVSYTHRRLLEHQTINNCPNVLAAGLYFLVNKLNPSNEKAPRRAVAVGTMLPSGFQELGVFPAALALPVTGIVRNTGSTISNLALAGGNVIYEIGTNLNNKRKKIPED